MPRGATGPQRSVPFCFRDPVLYQPMRTKYGGLQRGFTEHALIAPVLDPPPRFRIRYARPVVLVPDPGLSDFIGSRAQFGCT
jgi:hypothetical protein